MSMRLAGHRDGDDFTIILFEDNGSRNVADWTDLIAGASTVSGEARRALQWDDNGNVTQWGNWVTFAIDLSVRRGRKSVYTNLHDVQDGEYQIRFSIDGGPMSDPIGVRWP